MGVISFIALILLSFYTYSIGVVAKSDNSVDAKAQMHDLVILLCIWAIAICFRIITDYNKWLLILFCMSASLLVGLIATRKQTRGKNELRWGDFSKRVGGFQSRVMLSLFYFTIVLPLGLALRMFADPLGIKYKKCDSHWISKVQVQVDRRQLKRQS